LLEVMNVKKYFSYMVSDSIIVDETIVPDSIYSFLANNPQVLSAEQQVRISEQAAKEIAAQRYPSLKLNAGYNFNLTKNDAGLTVYNQNYGPVIGLSLLVPIYNGNVYNIQHKTAVYNITNARLQKDKLLQNLIADAIKTAMSYKNGLTQLVSQQKNKDLSARLVSLTMEKFKLNQSTILDVKTAQTTYENNAYLFVNLQYAAKASEIELKRLMFRLGK